MPTSISLRSPDHLCPSLPTESLTPPSLPFLSGTWAVTHSTLPMWRKYRNVHITYTPLLNDPSSRIDDLVTYQPLTSDSLKSVHGTDAPSFNTALSTLSWNWRGKGLLCWVTSQWEILGYGELEEGKKQWMVTYFAKTLFTPAGIDIYSRGEEGLGEEVVNEITKRLGEVKGANDTFKELIGTLFEVKRDAGKCGVDG
ncbi:MAG: hypothetical protein M1834_002774 [Cirrosporium novae-zelandiae]|nr:MAG: hypothetical protein M1834_002774 [Cirrosporium novae-zelandiae]